MITKLYRRIVPFKIRNWIYTNFLGSILYFLRNSDIIFKSKFTFLFGFMLKKTEENSALAFIGRHGITSYPYKYSLSYKKLEILVETDNSRRLPFILHNNKKLYFPTFFNLEKIKKTYRSLLIEQDIRSAHRYVKSYEELKGKTLFDIGSAEGIFALDTIEFVDHVYLFEYEDMWLAPLRATFEPWKEKVTIVQKYVSEKSEGINITIDDFLKDKNKNHLFLKMDIEGAERHALTGAKETLMNGNDINLAVCTYHRKDDPEVISKYLSLYGYKFELTEGLMYWLKGFNKGIIRAHN